MWFWVLIISIIYTEFVGYWAHRWLHAGHVQWLSSLHMEHHTDLYPAGSPMQTETYTRPPRDSWLETIGLEWIVPIGCVTLLVATLMLLFGVTWQYVLAGAIFSLIWAWTNFSYMHEQYHIKDTWWERNYVFKNWFKQNRKFHFVHHNDMKKNFGITFFWFDKIYETFIRKLKDASLVE